MNWIDVQDIFDNTVIGGNVDTDKLTPLINDAQILILEPILGTKLYDKIDTTLSDGLTGLYLQMFEDYIKPVLWHSVYADYIATGNVLARNSGIFESSPDNVVTADIDSVKYSSKQAKSKADVYIGRLERFLCDKQSEIPEYTYNQDEDYDLKPNKNINTQSGWYFEGGSYDKYKYDNLER